MCNRLSDASKGIVLGRPLAQQAMHDAGVGLERLRSDEIARCASNPSPAAASKSAAATHGQGRNRFHLIHGLWHAPIPCHIIAQRQP